jgi:hypothetical protein
MVWISIQVIDLSAPPELDEIRYVHVCAEKRIRNLMLAVIKRFGQDWRSTVGVRKPCLCELMHSDF